MKNIADPYSKELLKRALSESVMWNFAGRPLLKTHNWFIGLLRKLFRMGPDYVYGIRELPKAGGVIKFRRHGVFKTEK